MNVLFYVDLLESLTSWLENHMKECKQHTLISYLLTLAYVNYKPENMDNIIEVFICLFHFSLIFN